MSVLGGADCARDRGVASRRGVEAGADDRRQQDAGGGAVRAAWKWTPSGRAIPCTSAIVALLIAAPASVAPSAIAARAASRQAARRRARG